MIFLCMAGTDIIGDNRLKIIHGRRKTEKNFRLGYNKNQVCLEKIEVGYDKTQGCSEKN